MRFFFLGFLIAVLALLGVYYISNQYSRQKTELSSSDLILNRMKNVGKLVVTEGHFSEVITYKDAKKMYMDLFTAEKKALVVVNASAMISYDLSKLEYTIDQQNKVLVLTKIPEAEIHISPQIKYHNIEEDFLNQFTPKDHNLIQEKVTLQLNEKIKNSSLHTNSQNRLISELQKIYIVTNSLGWNIIYKGKSIDNEQNIEKLILD